MVKKRSKNLKLENIEFDTKTPTNVKRDMIRRDQDRVKKKRNRRLRNFFIALAVVVLAAAIGCYSFFLFTNAFEIEHVVFNGVEHLTQDEMNQLVDIEPGTSLLKVDKETIKKRLKKDAWIQDVDFAVIFPDTFVVNVTERKITAVVEVPVSATDKSIRNWAISSDHMWLMPIPDKNSEVAKSINQQIYSDVEGVIHIVDVSPSVSPEIGSFSSDDPVNNAIDVVAAMTTDLKYQVKYVKAADGSSTNIFLNNGVEIAIGTSEDIREKERVSKELLEKYEGRISYINVRNASTPTWRSI